MINTKPNILRNLLYIAFIISLLYSCNTIEKIDFESIKIDTSSLENCETIGCAEIDISLISSLSDDAVSVIINKEIERFACYTLDIGDDASSITNINTAIQHFNTSYQNLKQEFPDSVIGYEAAVDSEILHQDSDIVSVYISTYLYTGGAHGSQNSHFLNFNRKTGHLLTHRDLFKNLDRFTKYVEMIFRDTYNISNSDNINSTGFFFDDDVFVLPQNIGFNQDSIILLYNQYEIASYAEGPIEIKLSKESITKYLKL